jgi:hypothetical protein
MQIHNTRPEFYTDISYLGGVFAKNTSRGKFSLKTGIFRNTPPNLVRDSSVV